MSGQHGMSVWLYPDEVDLTIGALNHYLDHWDSGDPEYAKVSAVIAKLDSYKRSKLK